MRFSKAIQRLAAAALFCLSTHSLAAIQLVPVVSSGLTNPLFAGHAGDGSNRLFIVEQAGIIKVLQPGSSVPSVFLDIHDKILDGGERGLLGLAFHPGYAANGRFFVFYTRASDGAPLVIAEYGVSANPNVANSAETVLLTIQEATGNHNGGMIAFGPDGYLYIGVGDGGGSDDALNHAQNIDKLLGKILRIDVDHPDPAKGNAYSSPADNPYYGATPGRDEIFSIGWRNPWRFSFDRAAPHAQWVADVGQGLREEVNTPIVKGGNYGWRVYEGMVCTGLDPALCNPANYLFPLFDYLHGNNQCAITGGYVYRGTQGTLPLGTYVYADFCSGEIHAWNGVTQALLLDTAMSIASFGEDEAGELYVVDLDGSVSRIASTTCTYGIAPSSQNFGSDGGTGNVAVTAGMGCEWTATANAQWLHVTSNGNGTANGNVAYSVDAATPSSARSGTLTIAGKAFTVNQGTAFLDVDASIASTKYDALTDGLLTIRYLFGITGPPLTNSALVGASTRTDPAAIAAYLDGIRAGLDIDGNGVADALTDGLLVIRYLFGLRGPSLVMDAVDPAGTRTTAPAIEAYLQSLIP